MDDDYINCLISLYNFDDKLFELLLNSRLILPEPEESEEYEDNLGDVTLIKKIICQINCYVIYTEIISRIILESNIC